MERRTFWPLRRDCHAAALGQDGTRRYGPGARRAYPDADIVTLDSAAIQDRQHAHSAYHGCLC